MKQKLKNTSTGHIHQATPQKERDFYDCLIKELAKELRYSHNRINSSLNKNLELSSLLYALIELLSEKGILSLNELEKRKKELVERLRREFTESSIGLMYLDQEYDKYNFEDKANVNCLNRVHKCKAVCCKFPFALSRQDVEEGIIRWDFERPYVIAHDKDDYCVHLDRKTYQCTVREQRPVPCRLFDCKKDKKWQVWIDFDKKIYNEKIAKKITEVNLEIYKG